MLNEEQKKVLIDALNNKFGEKELHCPMCGNNQFTISDGYIVNLMQEDLKNFKIDKGIPSISIICDNCGFISQHALGTLGMLPVQEQPKEGVSNGKE